MLSCPGSDNKAGGLLFLPSLGIRHRETTALESRFLGRPEKDRRFVGVYGRGLMDLLPDGLDAGIRWNVFREEQAESVLMTIADDFFRYGLPFFEGVNSVDSVIAKFYENNRGQDQEGRLAILCALSGREGEAEAALERYIERANYPVPFFPRPVSRRFLSAFVEYFGIGGQLLVRLSWLCWTRPGRQNLSNEECAGWRDPLAARLSTRRGDAPRGVSKAGL